jgi:pyrroline-5-carboxylate reductase
MDGPILLVGSGKMGSALLQGWLARGADASQVIVVEPGAGARDTAAGLGVTVLADATLVDPGLRPRVIVFAIKPQAMDVALPAYTAHAGGRAVFLSIAAGRSLASLQGLLGPKAAIVRAMPNTPAAVGRGMSVLCANAVATGGDRAICEGLLAAVGDAAWVEDEALMDAVTAVSGSGPAYVFYLMECLAEAAVVAGLPAALASRLAEATVIGAAELCRQSATPPATLRENVTSPGGTTEAALNVLMGADGLQGPMTRAVAAAAARSREMAG